MVSDRRPHWDDDLINAVRTAMRPRILTCADTIDTYDVIAAVEDWQDKQIIGCRYACIGSQGAEIAELRAQIQRVRGIVDADQTVPIDARDPASYVAGYADATFRVRQVLDGGQR